MTPQDFMVFEWRPKMRYIVFPRCFICCHLAAVFLVWASSSHVSEPLTTVAPCLPLLLPPAQLALDMWSGLHRLLADPTPPHAHQEWSCSRETTCEYMFDLCCCAQSVEAGSQRPSVPSCCALCRSLLKGMGGSKKLPTNIRHRSSADPPGVRPPPPRSILHT